MPLADFLMRVCPSCGTARTVVQFCDDTHPDGAPHMSSRVMGGAPNPHLHRQCESCKFTWMSETFTGMIDRLAEERTSRPKTDNS